MKIIIPADYHEMSKTSAKIIAREIKRKHDLVLQIGIPHPSISTCGRASPLKILIFQ